MASTFNKLALTATRTSYRTPFRRKANPLTKSTPRHFHRPSRLLASKADSSSTSSSSSKTPTPPPGSTRQEFRFDLNDLDPDERASYTSLTPAEQAEWRADAQTTHDYYTGPDFAASMSSTAGPASQAIAREIALQKPAKPRPRFKQGFLAMGEEDAENVGPDPEYEGDDVTSLGHGELEQHREMREYARLAVWEMPLLFESVEERKGKEKGFEPPPRGNVLRFRYTTYMGEEHPAAKKIVVEWTTRDVAREAGLNEQQRVKLVKLVGVRYNPDSDLVKMSSERFETAAQNKRYLGDLVEGLIGEARDGEDMFEDVPLDFRHHKPKRVLEFPDAWKLNAEKRQRLMEERKRREELEASKVRMGERLIEGREIVREALRGQQQQPTRDESQVLLEQQQGGRRRAAPPRLR